ncbi:CPBP family intramembrane glutamic endopeptidase [Gordonia sp. CPCC 205333]|uniref:CPBP family intramembrane glutamic endopeptidase n=1 Tax=Gordonia sp. CPCC 205333 TaxID=3140790 RepID=UPI003AF3AFAE
MAEAPADPCPGRQPDRNRSVAGTAVIAVGVCVYAGALLIVTLASDGQLRFTADSLATVPMWHPLLAAIVGIALIQFTPVAEPPVPAAPDRRIRVEAPALLGLAMAFTILLTLLGPAEPNYTVLKVVLLVVAPAALFAVSRRFLGAAPSLDSAATDSYPRGRSWWALVPTLGWVSIYLALSLAHPGSEVRADAVTVVAVLIVGFVLNAVVEEFFYRRWLQSRWERILGGVWPAIIVSSILWASWHIAIQGTGDVVVDLANVVANQGVTGLFLGLLWQRYGLMWPLLLAHGAMNANPIALLS